MLNLIVFGAPGSGKGTQGKALASHYGLEHISTGDLLRDEIRRGTDLGKQAEKLISGGHLVPDDLIISLLEEKLEGTPTRKGIILDGFPRTVSQAKSLHQLLGNSTDDYTVLVDLKVEEHELIRRLLERGKVSGRSDDNEATIKERLKVYHSTTEPVIDYYKEKGNHLEIAAEGDIDEITEKIVMELASDMARAR
ncbi:MAG: adenylate kinase [Porphyromonas sp.]|nr:adenylate kinase [Porphyromonas sp.]